MPTASVGDAPSRPAIAVSETTVQPSDSSVQEPPPEGQQKLDIDTELEDHDPLDPIDVAVADRAEFEASSRDGFNLTDPTLLDILLEPGGPGRRTTAYT